MNADLKPINPTPMPLQPSEQLAALHALRRNPFFAKYRAMLDLEQLRIVATVMEMTPASELDFTTQEQLKGEYRGLARLATEIQADLTELTTKKEPENGTDSTS